MKIISWNVNGIRAVLKKWFNEFIKKENPDILCIQETKAFEQQFLNETWKLEWYNYVWHFWKKPWYAGTAIFYKNNLEILNSKNDFNDIEHFNTDWRVTEIEFNDFVILNCYFPNWWTKANWEEMLSYKLDFYDKIINYINNLVLKWKNIILTWDLNIVHTEIDIARPKENKNSIWFLPIEREKISELLNNWYIDTFRYFHPNKLDTYSWWSYRAWARPRNIWWRIDYFIVNNDFIDNISNIEYLSNIMWSDHCPVLLELK